MPDRYVYGQGKPHEPGNVPDAQPSCGGDRDESAHGIVWLACHVADECEIMWCLTC